MSGVKGWGGVKVGSQGRGIKVGVEDMGQVGGGVKVEGQGLERGQCLGSRSGSRSGVGGQGLGDWGQMVCGWGEVGDK